MDALRLGPFVLSMARLSALLAIALALGIAEYLERKQQRPLTAWAWSAALWLLAGARLAFVLQHWSVYRYDLLSIAYIWQGGFAPWGGLLALLGYSAWYFRSRRAELPAAGLVTLPGLALWLVLTQSSVVNPQELPAVSLERYLADGSNSTVSLALSSLVGQPLVINLWASWCGPCRREMPMMARVAQERNEVQMLFVNQAESLAQVQRYLYEERLELAWLLLDRQGQLADAMQAVGLPTTLFVDAQGMVQQRHVGEISEAALQAAINRLLP